MIQNVYFVGILDHIFRYLKIVYNYILMNVILNYNDYKKKLEIKEDMSIGEIQETILNICSLIIYNIEHSEIIYRKKNLDVDQNIIMGSEELPFNKIIKEFIEENEVLVIIEVNLYSYLIIMMHHQGY